MPLDRFTFLAQIANFLILLWLLRKFLFRPILKAVDEREARLDARKREAEAALAAAGEEKRAWEARHAEIENARGELLRRAEAEARERGEAMLGEARAAAAAEREKWERAMRERRSSFARDWAADLRREAFALAAAALREVADADLASACVRAFLRRLEALDAASLASLAPGPAAELAVRTSMELGREAAAALAAGLRRILRTEAPVRLGVDASLGLGMELSAGGRTLAWNVSDALAQLESLAGSEPGTEPEHDRA
jgi:F-type H+-transporting ATPase subunit b